MAILETLEFWIGRLVWRIHYTLEAVELFGLFLALASFVYASTVLIRTVWFGIDTPGYASTIVIILFFGGLKMLSVGILGEYVGRIYNEVRDRPLYIVRKTYDSEEEA